MKNLFGIDSPIFAVLSKVSDLVVLNFLWMISCLPIITIGASTAALYRCIFKIQKEGSIKIWKSFFGAFREEFKQGTVLFLIQLVLLAILVIDIQVVFFSNLSIGMIGQLVMCMLAILIIPGICFVFPLQAYFQNSIGRILKNAWLMAFSHLPASILISIINLLPLVLFFIWPAVFVRSLIVWLLIGGSLIAFTASIIFVRIFKRYE